MNLHPAIIFIYYIFLMIITLMIEDPIYILGGIIILGIYYRWAYGYRGLKNIKGYIVMGLMVGILNPLLTHRGNTILGYIFENPITLESSVYGIIKMMSLFLLLMIFFSYNKSFSPEKFLYIFSSIAQNTALMISMTLGFIPNLTIKYREIRDVQLQKGMMGQDDLRGKAKSAMVSFITLVRSALEDSLISAKSIKSRGYGIKKRVVYKKYKFKNIDIIFFVMMASIFLISISGIMKGYGKFEVYPTVSFIVFNIKYVVFFFIYVLFLILPFVMELREELLWKLSSLKNMDSDMHKKVNGR